jgi:hypothetical protein
MSILDTFKDREHIAELKSWDELKSLVTLDELKRYLRAEYISKEAHTRYQRKKDIMYAKAKELEAQGKL